MHADSVTVALVFVEAAVSRLPGGATQRSRVLATAGIPEALTANPEARVSARHFADLWLAVTQELQDEFFGLDSHGMRPGAFQLICRSVMTASTLGQGLARCLRGFGLFLHSVHGSLAVADGQAVLTVESAAPMAPAERFAQEIFATIVHGMVCWMVGRYVPFTRATFNYPRPPHWDEYHAMFGRSLVFDHGRTSLQFEARWLDCAVNLDEAALKPFLASSPLSLFVKYRNPHSWTARVRRQLRTSSPAHWPLLHALARHWAVAPSTLARRLGEEGTSYQRIKDNLRRDRAVQLLSSSAHSIEAVAAELGFEEASAFYRAFRRWTGTSPGSYRTPAAD